MVEFTTLHVNKSDELCDNDNNTHICVTNYVYRGDWQAASEWASKTFQSAIHHNQQPHAKWTQITSKLFNFSQKCPQTASIFGDEIKIEMLIASRSERT